MKYAISLSLLLSLLPVSSVASTVRSEEPREKSEQQLNMEKAVRESAKKGYQITRKPIPTDKIPDRTSDIGVRL